jgi:hypothetical protein
MQTRLIRLALASLVVILGASRGAEAAARVFVSVNGNDANNCANIATPCRTLNAAINQVDAAGEVIVIDTGSFAGATVTKSVKINVPTGVVAFSASPITVNAGASDVVVLRGLTIKAVTPGVGTGVDFTAGAALYVENCVIDGWATGISVTTGAQVFIKDTTVRNSTGMGLHATAASGSARVSVDLTRFEGNGGCGVHVTDNGKASIRDSVSSGNNQGFCASSATAAEVNVHNSVASNNTTDGVLAEAAAGVARVGSSIVTNNGTGFRNAGLAFQSLGNNLVQGNGTDTMGTITVVAGK